MFKVKYDEKILGAQKNKMDVAFGELGKLYYKAHKNDYEEAFAQPIAKIKEAEDTIFRHRSEVLKRSGLMLCKYCGEEILDVSRFCNFCGKPVEPRPKEERVAEYEINVQPETAAEEEAQAVAEQQEAPAEEEAPAPVEQHEAPAEEKAPQPQPVPEPDPEPEPQPEPEPEERKCPNCGKVVSGDNAFCENCGMRIQELTEFELMQKRWPLCGFTTSEDDVFYCVECGAKLQ